MSVGKTMGCTPTKTDPNTSDRYINSLVYHIHSSAPPRTTASNQTKIIQEDIVDQLEDTSKSLYDYDPTNWLQRAHQDMHSVREKGHWIAGVTGGGNRNNIELFTLNPQYQLSLHNKGSSKVLIGLRQMHPCTLPIGFHVYKSEADLQRLTAEYFLCVQPEVTSGDYKVRDAVWQLALLTQGTYVIIVSTYHPSSAKFELTVHSCTQFTLVKLIGTDSEYIE